MDVRIHDEASLFGAADTQRITSVDLPFELHVITTTSASSRDALHARVHDEIDGPNVVGLGIDPTHRWVVVRFGTGTGIDSHHWAAIVASGNTALREARWADGVVDIAREAARSRTDAIAIVPVPDVETPHHASSGIAGWVAGGLVLAMVLIVVRSWRRRRRAAFRWPAASHDPVTGYAIGSAMHPPATVDTSVVHHTVHHVSPSYDAGSSFGGGGGGGGFDGGGAGGSF